MPGVIISTSVRTGPSTATVRESSQLFIVGLASRGPANTATLIQSIADFEDIFGGYRSDSYLHSSVETFFEEGGTQVFVARTVGASATIGTLSLQNSASANVMTLSANGAGSWSATVGVEVLRPTNTTLKINLYLADSLVYSTGTVSSDTFATAVAQVAIAAGRDDSLPTLTGVHVEINEDTVTFAATDRYRLAVREIQWTPTAPNTSTTALLRARTIADAAKSLTGTKTVSISFAPSSSNDRLAGFAGDGKTMTSRMLDGTFPPYRHLLPQEVTSTALIEVATLLDSVRRVALVTDKTVPLRLDFNNNTLSLEAGAGEEAQATEAIEILLTGEPISIAFNPVFLADGLTAVGTKYVQISFTGPNKPAILMGKSDKDGALVENYRYLLMPMRYAS